MANAKKRQRRSFADVAVPKVRRSLTAIRRMNSLANYEHTDAQTKKVIAALNAEVAALEKVLSAPPQKRSQVAFDL